MKRPFAILIMICAGFSSAFGQKWPPSLEALLKNPSIPNQVPRAVDYRDDFPDLYEDSLYWEDRDFQTLEVNQRTYSRNHYNTLNQVIRKDIKTVVSPLFEGPWLRTSYEYNSFGQQISALTMEDYGGGIVNFQSRFTSVFNANNLVTERVWERYLLGAWTNEYRTQHEYGTTFENRVTYQFWADNNWKNQSRSTIIKNSIDQEVLGFREEWNLSIGDWRVNQERTIEYDSSGNIIQYLNKSGNPLQWAFRTDYHYNDQGQNDYYTYFTWKSTLNDWVKSDYVLNLFNFNSELIERFSYSFDTLDNEVLSSRQLFSYNEGIFSDAPKNSISQRWSPSTLAFRNESKLTNDYFLLSDDKAMLVSDYSLGELFGFPDWTVLSHGETFFHIGDNVSSPEPQALKPCQAPNPYPTNHKVTCDGLQENGSYMLYVYDSQGRVAYARHFKGGDGWSIHQNLPTGVYIAAIVRNGERISAQRLVIGR